MTLDSAVKNDTIRPSLRREAAMRKLWVIALLAVPMGTVAVRAPTAQAATKKKKKKAKPAAPPPAAPPPAPEPPKPPPPPPPPPEEERGGKVYKVTH
jgi:outer membrane biosynthesis protein TonB